MAERNQNLSVQEVVSPVVKGVVKTLMVTTEASLPPLSKVPELPLVPPQPTAPEMSPEAIQREAFLEIQREKMELAREKESFLKEKRLLADERERSGLGVNPLGSLGKKSPDPLTMGESEEEIANAVARFEAALSLGCPLCHVGSLEVHTTANGKRFFRCDNRSCGFITWKRPYPFTCPTCKNPFLVENDGGTGLSCPRSVCSFSQEGLEAPSEKKASSGTRRVRKVRRVVRKKR